MTNDSSSIWMQVTRPEVLGELIAIVTAILLAVISSRVMVAWHRRHGRRLMGTGWRVRLLECATLLAPYVIALVY